MEPIFFRSCGRQGRRLVLIHGNMASSRWWEPIMKDLKEEFQIIAVDMRGFGNSQPGKYPVNLLDHALDITEIMKKQGWEEAIVVGHSLGAAVAMQMAVSFPTYLEKLVLVDAPPADGMKNIDYLLLEQVTADPALAQAALKGIVAAEVDHFFMDTLLAEGMRSLAAVIPNTRALEQMNLTEELRAIRMPLLLIHGEKDMLVPLIHARETVGLVPQAHIRILPQVGHAPLVEAPEVLADCLREFAAKA